MKTKKPKKRNPADTTMRNINALKKRVERLEKLAEVLCSKFDGLIYRTNRWL